MKQLKTQVVYTLLISLAALAGMGIWVLVFGNYGEMEGRILATTALTGLFSLLCLAFLTQAGKKYQWFALAGVVNSVAALICGLILVWFNYNDFDHFVSVWRWFFVFGVLGVSMAHQSLLLLLVDKPKLKVVLVFTLSVIALVAGMFIYSLFVVSPMYLPENYWRIVGALVILDVLGTVATPILAKLNR